MPPLVSILIPAYNAEKWLAETIRSALAQTWPNIEVIVVDDGSTDRTADVARQFISQGVKLVTQTNQGGSAARNKAFAVSQGEYIQWLDADDLLAPDKIAGQMKAAEENTSPRTIFSSSWGMFFYRANKAKFSPNDFWNDLSPLEWLKLKMGPCLYLPPIVWLVSRELTQQAGPWDTRLNFDDDGEYFTRIVALSDAVKFVPEAKSYYRSSGSGSMSVVGESNKKMESLMLSMRLHLQYFFAVEESDATRATAVDYLRTWSFYFLPNRPDLFCETEKMVNALGGTLPEPRLWNQRYAILHKLFGWSVAKRAQGLVPKIKMSAYRFWDKTCFKLAK
jgi:glycosyltransferase involved in cell wall biosynthesis